jgi:thiol-disulfide isomerase/thioredoxin
MNMNFMCKSIYTLLLILTTAGAGVAQKTGSEKKVVFKGKADAKYNGTYVYLFSNLPKSVRDSAKIVNGTFTFSQPFTEMGDFGFYSGYEKKAKGDYSVLNIPFEGPAEISIEADMELLENSKVTGADGFQFYNTFFRTTNLVYEKMINELGDKYGKAYIYDMKRDTTEQKFKDMIRDYNKGKAAYNELLKQQLIKTVNEHPKSFASVLLLQNFTENLDLETAESLSKKLAPAIMDNFFGRNVLQQINGRKKSAIGSHVEDFTLNDPKDQPIRFSSLKKKYLLIDFWGSWCGPCHVAFKNLRTLHTKYQDKGFEILGIATENSKTAWLKDLEKEKLPWLQVIDEQGNKSISLGQFAVVKYPTTILVDANGKIVGRDLSIAALEKILDQL